MVARRAQLDGHKCLSTKGLDITFRVATAKRQKQNYDLALIICHLGKPVYTIAQLSVCTYDSEGFSFQLYSYLTDGIFEHCDLLGTSHAPVSKMPSVMVFLVEREYSLMSHY